MERPRMRMSTRRSRTPRHRTYFFDIGEYPSWSPSASSLSASLPRLHSDRQPAKYGHIYSRIVSGPPVRSQPQVEIVRSELPGLVALQEGRSVLDFKFIFGRWHHKPSRVYNAIPTQLVRRDLLCTSSAIAPVQSGRTFRCASSVVVT